MKFFLGLVFLFSITRVQAAGFSDCLRSVELPANSPINFEDSGEVKFAARNPDNKNELYQMMGFKKNRYSDDNPTHPYADFKGSEYVYAEDNTGNAKEVDVHYKISTSYDLRRMVGRLDIPNTLSIKRNDDTTEYKFRSTGENCSIENISKNNYTLYNKATCENLTEYNKKTGKKNLDEIKTQFLPRYEKPFAIETEDYGKFTYKIINETTLSEDDVKKFTAQCKAKIVEKPIREYRRIPGHPEHKSGSSGTGI